MYNFHFKFTEGVLNKIITDEQNEKCHIYIYIYILDRTCCFKATAKKNAEVGNCLRGICRKFVFVMNFVTNFVEICRTLSKICRNLSNFVEHLSKFVKCCRKFVEICQMLSKFHEFN